MKKTSITLLGLAAVLALSGCQNGVVATPFGDYGVKSRDGGRVTIGFINKKTPQFGSNTKTVAKAGKPKIVMAQGFHGRWVYTDNPKKRKVLCQDKYDSDDGVNLFIDAANNKLEVGYYESGYDAYWLKMQQNDANKVKGILHLAITDQGMDEPEIRTITTSMELRNKGTELWTHNVNAENHTAVFLLCNRTPQFHEFHE